MAQATIGELLRRYRREAGLTQKALASKICCDHSLVSRVETGEQFPAPEYLERFMGVVELALSAADRQEILTVYQQAQQQRRSPLTESPPALGESLPAQLPQLPQASLTSLPLPAEDGGVKQEPITPKITALKKRRAGPLIRVSVAGMLLLVVFVFSVLGKAGVFSESPPLLDLAVDSCQLTSVNPKTGELATTDSQAPDYITVWVNQPVTVTCQVRNEMDQPILIPDLVAGCRGPDAQFKIWQANKADFPHVLLLSLRPGEVYTYSQARTFFLPGDYYFVEMTKRDVNGKWNGIEPSPRLWFRVADLGEK